MLARPFKIFPHGGLEQSDGVSTFSRLYLRESLNPFGDFAFTDTPLSADLKCRKFVLIDHTAYCSLRDLQNFSRLVES